MLKLLRMRKKLDDAKKEYRTVLEHEKELQARADEILNQIDNSSDENEAEIDEAEIDEAVEAWEAEKKENEEAKTRLSEIIESLENEIEAEKAKEPNGGENEPEKRNKETKTMEVREREYLNAYAEYIKTGKDEAVRALAEDMEYRSVLTENATNGVVPVPTFVYDLVKTAWEREQITSLATKTFLPGNLKVGFEMTATDAAWHTEGAAAPNEESLTIGVVSMVPQTAKKWITISDEVLDMAGEEFLRYIYDEITYRIAKFVAGEAIKAIGDAPTASTKTAAGQAKISAAPALDTVAKAVAKLSDEATDAVIVMNKATYAAFKSLQLSANYAVDVFDGLRVIFDNSLPAYDSASAGATYMIVGDFGKGLHLNFSNGYDGVTFKFDDLSLSEKDLVKIVGRMPVAIGVVAPNAFTRVAKASA